jgi:MFS family permease
MNLRPKAALTEADVKRGLRLVIGDGLTTETMTALTTGAFLVSFALMMGANNFQIGLLAAIPTGTNIFQLLSIWLVRRYNNRRAVAVICSVLARVPLLIIASVPLLFETTSIDILVTFLFFFYFFGSIANPAWNSWMKDLVPEGSLGSYFATRTSYAQSMNMVVSLLAAFLVDFVKESYPQYELYTYALMFMAAGISGLTGAWLLYRTPEPQSFLARENIFILFKRPLKNPNFRKLLAFNSAWVFAINIATPFFVVFLLKSIGLPLSYIIALTIVEKLCSILTVRIWGRYSDRYSNKTVIAILAPLYIFCLIGWCFVGIYSQLYANLILLAFIHIFSGIANGGITLSLTNIGLKLAPREDAIVYLSVKNIVTAFFSSMAPLLGGILADYFNNRSLTINAHWLGPVLNKEFHLISLHQWNFLFAIGAILAFIAVELLFRVKEVGEVEKDVVVRVMRSNLKSNLKEAFLIGQMINWHDQFWRLLRGKTGKENEEKPEEPEENIEQGTRNIE